MEHAGMMTPLRLPYFRNVEELPAPIPTIEEILASNEEILKGAEDWAFRKVVRVGEHFIVKYSQYNCQVEGENLMALENNGIKGFVPRIYAMWKEDDGQMFLVMERLRGETLEFMWPSLVSSEKTIILSQLRGIFSQIRKLPDYDLFGSVVGGSVPHHLFFSSQDDQQISGPFKTERAFVQGLIAKCRREAEFNQRYSYLADFFEQQLLRVLVADDRKPVFTHSDIQRKNILVERLEEATSGEKFRVSVVDWESAGWYPVWWEYVAAFFAFKWSDDWCSRVVEAVDDWPAEAAMMHMIYQDLF
ncbi:hypothetical protein EAE96_000250 [Botrytis aclada]|nr:hypothetical protein EAE96_000250 [Botrytis aclada]